LLILGGQGSYPARRVKISHSIQVHKKNRPGCARNDINDSTRAQLDAISTALAELQAKPSETKPRKPIGFIQPKDEDDKL